MVNLWLSSELKYGKARDRQGVRGPLLRFHTFFSAHTTDNTLKSSWTSPDEKTVGFFGQLLRSISGGIAWYRHSIILLRLNFFAWVSPPPKQKFKVFFSSKIAVYWCRCPDMPWCPKMPAFCAKIVFFSSLSEYNKKGDRYEELFLYMLWWYIWQDICWDADVYRW